MKDILEALSTPGGNVAVLFLVLLLFNFGYHGADLTHFLDLILGGLLGILTGRIKPPSE